MSDPLVRLAVVAAVGLAAVAWGFIASRRRRTHIRPADLSWLDEEVPVVAFTSTSCANCREVMRLLGTLDVPVREVAYEREPELFDRAGVDDVPLVVVAARRGRNWQRAGRLRESTVRRALARAGW